MKQHNCATCTMKKRYQKKPQSLLAKLWKWHTGWCPGWKKYISSLRADEKLRLDEELTGAM